MPATADIRRQYTRSDPRGRFPRVSGAPGIDCNRLAAFWRPMIDMTDRHAAPISLRMIRPVSEWIAEAAPGRVSWFSRIALPGLRRQVLLHAGLESYDAVKPSDLPVALRTPAWQRLVDAVEGFADLDAHTRALVVFQLAQLTFCQYAIALTGLVPPTGEPGGDHWAYEVARVHARVPGRAAAAMPVFEALAAGDNALLAYHACFQGIAHAVRTLGDVALAQRFAGLAERLPEVGGDWPEHMTRSRFHRALVRLRFAEGRRDEVRRELDAAWHHQDLMEAHAPDDPDVRMVTDENLRDLMELEIETSRGIGTPADRVVEWAAGVVRLDPNAVEARLAAGDGYAVAGDWATAAHWYAHAGELGATAGANGWYRAAQCFDRLGDRDRAVDAMGRCLELDTTAVEPRRYLEEGG